jgi:DNA-binding PadR family transcriptional regulator
MVYRISKKGVETAKEWHKSEDGLEWHKQQSIKSWENREYKIKVCESGKEYETRHSGISKFCHQNCKQRNRTKD